LKILKTEIEIAKKAKKQAQHPYSLVNYYRACMYNIQNVTLEIGTHGSLFGLLYA